MCTMNHPKYIINPDGRNHQGLFVRALYASGTITEKTTRNHQYIKDNICTLKTNKQGLLQTVKNQMKWAECSISSGSALFADTKLIFRERNTIFFWKLKPVTPAYIQWSILSLLYLFVWERDYMGLDARKPVFRVCQTTKAPPSLRIWAV